MSESKPSKSKAAWSAAAVHEDITLPSGFKVDIKLPNLAALIKAGQLPNELLQAAQKVAALGRNPNPEEAITPELYDQMESFNNFVVAHTVVKPSIAEEDVSNLPSEDIDMVVGFAMRRIDFDAVGHHIAGLETIESFRRFRGIEQPDIASLLSGEGG